MTTESAGPIIQRADEDYFRGCCDDAILLLTDFIARTPGHEGAVIRLAELLIDSEKHARALEFLKLVHAVEDNQRAFFRPAPGCELVVSTDMLVAGTHFFADTDPEDRGWKALAVNLSDLAAMGAQPRWAVLAAALPSADEAWIASFCRGFFGLAERFKVDVIGGDTTRGPLNLAPTVFGEIPAGQAVTRSGARPGDDIWVSGSPGLAGLGLASLQGRVALDGAAGERCVRALQRPQPRIELGIGLRGLARAAIDVSDGLLADLGHVLERSWVGAEIREADLPQDAARAAPSNPDIARECLLAGGDDYELLFTAGPDSGA